MEQTTQVLRTGLKIGTGPKRIFPLRTVYAQFYATQLLSAGVDFAVVFERGRVDFVTPYDLRADLYPRPTWVEGDEGNDETVPNPFGDS